MGERDQHDLDRVDRSATPHGDNQIGRNGAGGVCGCDHAGARCVFDALIKGADMTGTKRRCNTCHRTGRAVESARGDDEHPLRTTAIGFLDDRLRGRFAPDNAILGQKLMTASLHAGLPCRLCQIGSSGKTGLRTRSNFSSE